MKEVNNSFEGGLITDTSNLQTPKNVYTYLENGTFITYEGDEVILQSEEGNTYVSSLKENYVVLDVKSFGNVAYIISAETEVSTVLKDEKVYDKSKSQHKLWLEPGNYRFTLTKSIINENDINIISNDIEIVNSSFSEDTLTFDISITVENSSLVFSRFLSAVNLNIIKIKNEKIVNGFTGRGEVGTFPSPDYENAVYNTDNNTFSTVLTNDYRPLSNYKGDNDIPLNPFPIGENQENIGEFNSLNFNFQIDKELEIVALQKSYDDTINIIFTDGFNKPKLVNSRFTNISGLEVKIINRSGVDENIYSSSNFDNTLNHLINSKSVVNTFFSGQDKGQLPVGFYKYFIKYETTDGNQSSVVSQSFKISTRIGDTMLNTNCPINFENSGKSNNLSIQGIDTNYSFIRIYYEYSSSSAGLENAPEVYRIENKIETNPSISFQHFGYESSVIVDPSEILNTDSSIETYKTGAEVKGRLIIGNVKSKNIDNLKYLKIAKSIYIEQGLKLVKDSLAFNSGKELPFLKTKIINEEGYYFNPELEYENTGYFGGETYCFGISFYLDNGVETPIFPVRGIDNLSGTASYSFNDIEYDDITGENTKGIFRFSERKQDLNNLEKNIMSNQGINVYFPKFNFSRVIGEMENSNIISFRIHRTKRKENVFSQGILFDTMIVPNQNREIDFYKNGEFSGGYTKNNSRYIPAFGYIIESAHRKEKVGDIFFKDNPELWGIIPHYFNYFAIANNPNNPNNSSFNKNLSFYAGRKHCFISPDLIVDPSTIRTSITTDDFVIRNVNKYQYDSKVNTSIVSGTGSIYWSIFKQTGKISSARDSTQNDFRLGDISTKIDFVDVNNSSKTENGFTSLFEGFATSNKDRIGPIFISEQSSILPLKYNNYLGLSSNGYGFAANPSRIPKLFRDIKDQGTRVIYDNSELLNITAPSNATNVQVHKEIANNVNIYPSGGIFETRTLSSLYDFPNETFYPVTQNIILNESKANEANYPTHVFKAYKPGSSNQDANLSFVNSKYTLRNLGNGFQPFVLNVFQGDTYINPTFRRVYYNSMSRQTLGSNLVPNQSELAKINIGYIVCFYSESKYNVANQTTNIFDVNEGERSFLPFSAKNYEPGSNTIYNIKSTDNDWRNYRLPESEEFNNGVTTSSFIFGNTFDSNSPFTQNNFSTRIHASGIDSNISFVNNYRFFNSTNFKDYSKKLGEIVALRNVNGKLFCVHEYGITQIPVNERIAQAGDSAGEVFFESVQVLNPMENIGYISEKIGSKFQKSVIVSENTMYGVDMERGVIWRISSNGLELISDFKVNKVIKEIQDNYLTSYNYFNKIDSYYDFNKNNIIFSFNIKESNYKVSEKSINLIYNEIPMNSWSTFTSWKPNSVFNIRNNLYSLNALKNSNKIYQHYNDSFMTYYDKQEFFIVEFVTTISSQIHQLLENFKIVGEHMYPEFIEYETENENFRQYVKPRNKVDIVPQSLNPLLNVVNYNAEYREGHTYIETVKDIADTELKYSFDNKKIRGKYFKVKFFYRPTNKKIFIQNIISIINPSFS